MSISKTIRRCTQKSPYITHWIFRIDRTLWFVRVKLWRVEGDGLSKISKMREIFHVHFLNGKFSFSFECVQGFSSSSKDRQQWPKCHKMRSSASPIAVLSYRFILICGIFLNWKAIQVPTNSFIKVNLMKFKFMKKKFKFFQIVNYFYCKVISFVCLLNY